jgi:NCS1 family nucleobase:cation symporter-1
MMEAKAGHVTSGDAGSESLSHPEVHGIDYVPDSARHGRPSSLFTLWFGATAMMVTIVTGAVVADPAMGFGWFVLAVALGAILGSFLAAFHSAQGPAIGLPQMIQTRAQFGYAGGALPMFIVLFSWFVFLPPTAAIFAEMLSILTPVNVHVGVALFMVLGAAIALWGYDLCHQYARVVAILSVVTLGAASIVAFATHSLPHQVANISHGSFNTGAFLAALGLAFIYAGGYSGGVADYSRYLPRSTSSLATGLWTGLGIGIPTFWLFVLGGYLALRSGGNPDIAAVVATSTGSVGTWLTDVVFAVGLLALIAQGMLIIYVGTNTLMAVINSVLVRKGNPTPSFARRAAHLLPFAACGLVLGEIATGHAAAFLDDSLSILLVLIIPWSAINLADFYIVRHGHYSITDMFEPRGRYGVVNSVGMASYVITLAIELPFIHVLSYQGPVAGALGGGDISWLVGVVVGIPVYSVLMRKFGGRYMTTEPAVDEPVLGSAGAKGI